ncbi:hypothetical protein SAMN06265795_103295 [Noviherbaspirillum humi]|uniref:Uncharacterized protein n=1 Tax=Noviherbaspirillum humi TaxID=1688639 RepID=A0A239FC01_9BURK|nr:hypothetical protein [Noviherbaspirillum humi]SNS54580.1 hypothetical protein SAMN06265795_103295 [Noviherbaspirillum humi]
MAITSNIRINRDLPPNNSIQEPGPSLKRGTAQTASTSSNGMSDSATKKTELSTPLIAVFDVFSNADETVRWVDVNNDGMNDFLGHGDIVSAIIQAKTGIAPEHHDASPEAVVTFLCDLNTSRKGDFQGVFLNFSQEVSDTPEVVDALIDAAKKGAKITISEGNRNFNQLALNVRKRLGGKKHPNIAIVAASDGRVGEKPSMIADSKNVFRKDLTDAISNGRLKVIQVRGGFDINGDKFPDLSDNVVFRNWNDLTGKKLAENWAPDDVRKKIRGGAQVGELWTDSTLNGKLIRISDIGDQDERELVLRDLAARLGLTKNQIQGLYVDLGALSTYVVTMQSGGGLVVYSANGRGELSRLSHKGGFGDAAATSWAAPNYLADLILQFESTVRRAR